MRAVLQEIHDSIGDEGGANEGMRARARVMRLLMALGWEAPEVPPPPPEEPQANGTAQSAAAADGVPLYTCHARMLDLCCCRKLLPGVGIQA